MRCTTRGHWGCGLAGCGKTASGSSASAFRKGWFSRRRGNLPDGQGNAGQGWTSRCPAGFAHGPGTLSYRLRSCRVRRVRPLLGVSAGVNVSSPPVTGPLGSVATVIGSRSHR